MLTFGAATGLYTTGAYRTATALPLATRQGGLAELPLAPRLKQSELVKAMPTGVQKSIDKAAESRVLPRPDWFPKFDLKTLGLVGGVGVGMWVIAKVLAARLW